MRFCGFSAAKKHSCKCALNNNNYGLHFFCHFILKGGQLGVDDQDPLPNEDVSVGDENISNNVQHPVNSEFITISVTNENGEKIKGQLPNG